MLFTAWALCIVRTAQATGSRLYAQQLSVFNWLCPLLTPPPSLLKRICKTSLGQGRLLAVPSELLSAHFGEQFMFAEPRIHCHGYMAKPAKCKASGMCLKTIFRQRVPCPPFPYTFPHPRPALLPLSFLPPHLFSEFTSLTLLKSVCISHRR